MKSYRIQDIEKKSNYSKWLERKIYRQGRSLNNKVKTLKQILTERPFLNELSKSDVKIISGKNIIQQLENDKFMDRYLKYRKNERENLLIKNYQDLLFMYKGEPYASFANPDSCIFLPRILSNERSDEMKMRNSKMKLNEKRNSSRPRAITNNFVIIIIIA